MLNLPHAFSREIAACIEACRTCALTCRTMAMTHCLESGGRHTEPPHFRLMMDCATICDAAAAFMAHKSQFHYELCGLCSKICEACAASCAQLDGMQPCVEACRACAQHCGHMAEHHHAPIQTTPA
jgi:hypothetical protein